MRIVGEARDDMPMQVRHLVPQAGNIHLRWREELDQRPLQSEYDAHQVHTLRRSQVMHFFHMLSPNDSA
jgi:hypothetical protein